MSIASTGGDVTTDGASTAQISISGDTNIKATSHTTAHADSEMVSFGVFSGGISVPTSEIGTSVSADYDGSVTGGGDNDRHQRANR